MRKILSYSVVLFVAIALLSSCKSRSKLMIPIAMNTVNSVTLQELNLKHGNDYKILNTISATGVVEYHGTSSYATIKEENGEFKLAYSRNKEGDLEVTCDGIARFGFLSNDYGNPDLFESPLYVSRNLAIYRLINACKVAGADGVIEPVISTNVEQVGRNIIFKTTATAKLIKLIADK